MAGESIVFVADAGSVARGNFHWVCSRNLDESSTDPAALAQAIAIELKSNNLVSLGYESPLFVPCEKDPMALGRARKGECQKETGNRPFNAGAGASVLATGIQSLVWVLCEVKQLYSEASATTRWTEFIERRPNVLFIWEAFVSGSEKALPPSHAGDARLAIEAFQKVKNAPENPTRIECACAFSLAGAALLRAGLSSDHSLLAEPCVVLRPLFS